MIKFFRRIRQRLLSQNRFSKYLIYALGEIILVVIGILIALQVNNWNENRKLNKRVKVLLPKLKSQIVNNLNTAKGDFEKINYFFEASKRISNSLDNKNDNNQLKKIDSLILFTGTDFYLNLDMIILNEAQTNEDLSLIKSDTLRETIYLFIKANKELIERVRIVNEDLKISLKPYLNRHYNIKNLLNSLEYSGLNKSKIYNNDNYKILESQEFENIIVTRIMYLEDLSFFYKELKEILETVNNLLEKEILLIND